MGSITSRPKVPEPIVVRAPSVSVATSSNTQTDTGSDTSQTVEQSESEARAQNLLQRNRGRLGTIISGFRGVLNTSNASTGKTLLGE